MTWKNWATCAPSSCSSFIQSVEEERNRSFGEVLCVRISSGTLICSKSSHPTVISPVVGILSSIIHSRSGSVSSNKSSTSANEQEILVQQLFQSRRKCLGITIPGLPPFASECRVISRGEFNPISLTLRVTAIPAKSWSLWNMEGGRFDHQRIEKMIIRVKSLEQRDESGLAMKNNELMSK